MKFLSIMICTLLFLGGCSFSGSSVQKMNKTVSLLPPSLDNNPQFDMILTNERPILSANNPVHCPEVFAMDFEISKDPMFPVNKTIVYSGSKYSGWVVIFQDFKMNRNFLLRG